MSNKQKKTIFVVFYMLPELKNCKSFSEVKNVFYDLFHQSIDFSSEFFFFFGCLHCLDKHVQHLLTYSVVDKMSLVFDSSEHHACIHQRKKHILPVCDTRLQK